jgi:hypothetical protein
VSVLVLLLAAVVPLTLVGALVTVLVRSGRGSHPENTPAATLVAARRHENVATTLGLAGGLAVAAVLIALAGNGARLVPGPPGLAAALAPTAGALVNLGMLAVGLADGIVSLVAATNVFTPGGPSLRRTAVDVPAT